MHSLLCTAATWIVGDQWWIVASYCVLLGYNLKCITKLEISCASFFYLMNLPTNDVFCWFVYTVPFQEEYQQELMEARKQQELQAEYANKLEKVCASLSWQLKVSVATAQILPSNSNFILEECLHSFCPKLVKAEIVVSFGTFVLTV